MTVDESRWSFFLNIVKEFCYFEYFLYICKSRNIIIVICFLTFSKRKKIRVRKDVSLPLHHIKQVPLVLNKWKQLLILLLARKDYSYLQKVCKTKI